MSHTNKTKMVQNVTELESTRKSNKLRAKKLKILTSKIKNITVTLSSDIHTGSSCCFLISSLTREYQLSMEPAGITAKR